MNDLFKYSVWGVGETVIPVPSYMPTGIYSSWSGVGKLTPRSALQRLQIPGASIMIKVINPFSYQAMLRSENPKICIPVVSDVIIDPFKIGEIFHIEFKDILPKLPEEGINSTGHFCCEFIQYKQDKEKHLKGVMFQGVKDKDYYLVMEDPSQG